MKVWRFKVLGFSNRVYGLPGLAGVCRNITDRNGFRISGSGLGTINFEQDHGMLNLNTYNP